VAEKRRKEEEEKEKKKEEEEEAAAQMGAEPAETEQVTEAAEGKEPQEQ